MANLSRVSSCYHSSSNFRRKTRSSKKAICLQSLVSYLDSSVLPQDKKESERVLQLDRVNYLYEKGAPHYIADIQKQEQAHTS